MARRCNPKYILKSKYAKYFRYVIILKFSISRKIIYRLKYISKSKCVKYLNHGLIL